MATSTLTVISVWSYLPRGGCFTVCFTSSCRTKDRTEIAIEKFCLFFWGLCYTVVERNNRIKSRAIIKGCFMVFPECIGIISERGFQHTNLSYSWSHTWPVDMMHVVWLYVPQFCCSCNFSVQHIFYGSGGVLHCQSREENWYPSTIANKR